ncbi:MAG: nucleotidyltransferase domain-containing protein [Acidipropionibacterium sp.]|jgi:predicted nucleotidyltransferase|nr:nucleotidyltransferase domain-containing protein [Acidipropionibacterium sp.]
MSRIVASPEALALRELISAHRDGFQALLGKYAATNPRLFGSVARGTAHEGSDIDILVEMDPADGNLLMRASGLMEETRALFGRDDIDVFPVQLLRTTDFAVGPGRCDRTVSRSIDQRVADILRAVDRCQRYIGVDADTVRDRRRRLIFHRLAECAA